jgi:hypothetical protein
MTEPLAHGAEEAIEFHRRSMEEFKASEFAKVEDLMVAGEDRKAACVELADTWSLDTRPFASDWNTLIENERSFYLTGTRVKVEYEAIAQPKALPKVEQPSPSLEPSLVAPSASATPRLKRLEELEPKPPDPNSAEWLAGLKAKAGVGEKPKSDYEEDADDVDDDDEASSAEALPGVLNPKAPVDSASKLVALRYWNDAEKCQTLVFWQKQYWHWCGTHWKVLDDDTMRAKVYRFLDQAEIEVGRGRHLERFEPDREAVNKVMDALRSRK